MVRRTSSDGGGAEGGELLAPCDCLRSLPSAYFARPTGATSPLWKPHFHGGFCDASSSRILESQHSRAGPQRLGLAAQRHDIEAFGAREGFLVQSWYQDVQTGAGKDALLLRPRLAAALKEARAARCALMVSRLDRLSRNVHFITGLMEHKVHFVVAALSSSEGR